MTSNTILGIDLGTTNSASALWTEEGPVHVPNALGALLTPSVVGVDDDGSLLVGQAARQRLVTHPEATVAYFKRLMGTDHVVSLGRKHAYTAVELSSLVLGSLKRDAENHLGHEVNHAVISVPAYFNEHQRQATRDAGELAGLQVNRLINEPTAAAIAHGLQEKEEHTIMVLDLGGGTFDVSILEYFDGILEVHSSAGDSALGGEDFTEALVKFFLEHFEIDAGSLSATDSQRLYARMETAKRAHKLNEAQAVQFNLNGQLLEWTLSDDAFKKAVAPLLLRLRSPMERALRDANLTKSEIDEVVLVGGSTRMQSVRSLVASAFGVLPKTDIDPDLTIASGAAVQAGLVAKNEQLDDVVLTDVCPFSLGIATVNENKTHGPMQFSPIIERNTIVPVSRIDRFYTVEDNQTRIAVQIYQGESPWVDRNLFLGDVDVKVQKRKAAEEAIDVRFSYDVNGLLEVDITVVSTGAKINHIVENRPGSLTPAQIEKSRKKLLALKVLPREREEVRVLLARAERVFASLLGDDRQLLQRHIQGFERVLDSQDVRAITSACDDFEQTLNAFEQDVWQ